VNIEVPQSVQTLESIYTEKEAFQLFLLPVTMNFIRKEAESRKYWMSFPLLGEELFSVWRSKTETKNIHGKIHRDMRKLGYDKKSIPEKSTRVKFNINCWAFKGYYTYHLSSLGDEKTFLTINSEYRAHYSIVKSLGKVLSFIMDG
jgi:hypothetical protein